MTYKPLPSSPASKSEAAPPRRYEPDTNPTYADLARHYGFAILPACPRRPRDKAKVEVGVLLAERWILAALRHRHFTVMGNTWEWAAHGNSFSCWRMDFTREGPLMSTGVTWSTLQIHERADPR